MESINQRTKTEKRKIMNQRNEGNDEELEEVIDLIRPSLPLSQR